MVYKVLCLVVGLVSLAGTANAQLFGSGVCTTADGPCSGLADQLVQIARQIDQLAQETITAVQEVLNTTALGGMLFQDATGDLQAITGITTGADLLANNTGLFINDLAAPAYPLPANGMQQLILHQNAVANAISTLGQVIDTENPNIAANAATIASLTVEALAAVGRQQTLQDKAQINAAHAQQLQSFEAVHMAHEQAQHAAMLANRDRQAMADAWGDLAATAYTPYPMTGQDF